MCENDYVKEIVLGVHMDVLLDVYTGHTWDAPPPPARKLHSVFDSLAHTLQRCTMSMK